MTRTSIHFVILGLVLILVQVLIFDNVCLFNVAVPIVFVYLIFKLPAGLSRNIVLTISFFLGLIIDIFTDTYGMNTLACTVTAMIRSGLLPLFIPRGEVLADPIPSVRTLGRGRYIRYMTLITLSYCTLIFVIQAFTFFNIWLTVARIAASTLLSLLIMFAIDIVTTRQRNEKRL